MSHVTFIGNEEQRLVKRLQEGDKTAARDFYSLYADTLAGICMRYIADEEDLKDVLQNAFAHIFSHIAEFEYRGAGSLLAWAKRVVINESLKYLRTKVHFEELQQNYDLADESEDEKLSIGDIPPDAEPPANRLSNGTEPLRHGRQEPSGDSHPAWHSEGYFSLAVV